MRVAELRAILAHLPDELPVIVPGHAGAFHVGAVVRTRVGASHFRGSGEPWPATVKLESRYGWWQKAAKWHQPEPPYEIHGPVRNRAGLTAELDALNPLAAAPPGVPPGAADTDETT